LSRPFESNGSPPASHSAAAIRYLAAAALSGGLAAIVLEVWNADPSIPLVQRLSGDALFYEMLVKGMIDNGGYLHNRFLGMPWGQELYDYPLADQLHLLVLKLLSPLAGGPGAAINLYFLASFPLVAICGLAALRQLGVSGATALVASVLFSLLPFHFLRGETHLFLALYYLVPLVLMVALWLALDIPLTTRDAPRRLVARGYVAIVVMILSGIAGIYHAFFSGFFVAMSGIAGAASRRSRRPLLAAAALVAILLGTLVVALSPSLLYVAREGRNPLAAVRLQSEAETYGLKLAHLVLPIQEHRFPPFAKLRRQYDHARRMWPSENENRTAALGLVASFGFLCLTARIVFGWPRFREDDPLLQLARLALGAVLLTITGGFASLVSLLVSPAVRGYNRVSVFIAFLCLAAVAIALDRLRESWTSRRVPFWCFLAALLTVGVLDQTSPSFVPPYAALAETLRSDRDFVRSIESTLPADAMVFQLPRVAFFEGSPVYHTRDYEPVGLYLQSHRLRWSYGAMKGRLADDWQVDLLARPLDDVVERLALVGFAGITVDREAWADEGRDIERRLSELLQAPGVPSPNGRYAFFDLGPFAATLRARLDAQSWTQRREAAWHPTLIAWRGCGTETDPDNGVRRCPLGAEIELRNTASEPRRVVVDAELVPADEQPIDLSLAGTDLSMDFELGATPRSFERTIVLPPGKTALRFAAGNRHPTSSGGAAMIRVLRFWIRDLQRVG
jgi:phosphoglycerol transferase